MYRAYLAWQRRAPTRVSIATGFSVMSIGDLGMQCTVGGRSEIDLQQNVVSATHMGLMSPLFLAWWVYLERIWPGRSAFQLARKVVVNQVVITSVNLTSYLGWCTYVEAYLAGATNWAAVTAAGLGQARRELPRMIGNSFLLWVPVNTLNFAFVPPHLKVPYSSAVSVLWGGYLSFVAHRDVPAQPHSESDTQSQIEADHQI